MRRRRLLGRRGWKRKTARAVVPEAQDGRPEGLFRVPSGNVVGKPTDPGLLDVEQDPKVRCKTERFATYQERLSDLIGSCWGTYGMA